MKPTESHHLKKHRANNNSLKQALCRSSFDVSCKETKECLSGISSVDTQCPEVRPPAPSFPLLSHRVMDQNQTPPSDHQPYILLTCPRATEKAGTTDRSQQDETTTWIIIDSFLNLQHIWSTETFVTIKPETDGRICSQTQQVTQYGKGDVTKEDSFKVVFLLLL